MDRKNWKTMLNKQVFIIYLYVKEDEQKKNGEIIKNILKLTSYLNFNITFLQFIFYPENILCNQLQSIQNRNLSYLTLQLFEGICIFLSAYLQQDIFAFLSF